jgi:hypothetical protein
MSLRFVNCSILNLLESRSKIFGASNIRSSPEALPPMQSIGIPGEFTRRFGQVARMNIYYPPMLGKVHLNKVVTAANI